MTGGTRAMLWRTRTTHRRPRVAASAERGPARRNVDAAMHAPLELSSARSRPDPGRSVNRSDAAERSHGQSLGLISSV